MKIIAVVLGLIVGGLGGYVGADSLATRYFANSGVEKNGWTYALDYAIAEPPTLAAAAFAKHVMVANVAEEAVYYKETGDTSGNRAYALTIGANDYPPTNAFWSLTIYYGELPYNLVKNPIDRSVISNRTEGFMLGDDGSMEILIQHEQPDGDKTANWLPAPDGAFLLVFRVYEPQESILDGSYAPPPLQLVGNGG